MNTTNKIEAYIFESNVNSLVFIAFYLLVVLITGIRHYTLDIVTQCNPYSDFHYVRYFFYLPVLFLILTLNDNFRKLGNMLLFLCNVIYLIVSILLFFDV